MFRPAGGEWLDREPTSSLLLITVFTKIVNTESEAWRGSNGLSHARYYVRRTLCRGLHALDRLEVPKGDLKTGTGIKQPRRSDIRPLVGPGSEMANVIPTVTGHPRPRGPWLPRRHNEVGDSMPAGLAIGLGRQRGG